MLTTLELARPLALTLFHRLRPAVARRQRRQAVSFVLAAALYGLVFAFLTSTFGTALGAVRQLAALRAFGGTEATGLELRLAAAGVALALGLLFAIGAGGSAARSLDTTREGRDLYLLVTMPVRTGAVLTSRALAAALVDPLGFLLLGPPLAALVLAQAHGAGWAALALVMALALYVALRTLVQSAALALIVGFRAWLPKSWRAEPLAAAAAALAFAAVLAATGVNPIELSTRLRAAPSVLEPLSALEARVRFLVPAPLSLALEGTALLEPGPLAAGWAGLLLALMACQWASSRFPPHLLLARTQRARGARALGTVWDALWPHATSPALALLLKDAITAWRANLMLAPALPVLFPVSLVLVHRLNPLGLGLPPAALLAPFVILAATALGASFFELAEGTRPPPMPVSRGGLAALKAVSCSALTMAAALALLFAAYPVDAAAPAAGGVLAAAALMPILLIELLCFAPGAAAEVFSPAGIRTALLWSLAAVGTAGLMGEADSVTRLTILFQAVAAAWAMWGRERLLAHDLSLADALVLVSFFGFASRVAAIVTGFGAALAPGWAQWVELAVSSALQLGLLAMAVEYLRLTGGGRGARRLLGLPPGRPVLHAVAGVAAGLSMAALFAAAQPGGAWSGVPGAGLGALALARMLLASAAGPIAEECFFRGVVQRALRGALGRPGSVLATAVLFAAAHGGPPSGTLAVLGLLLGVLYEWKGSVYAPILAHVAFNHVQVVLGALAGELARGIGL
ncbi:MAG: CPBP family intramembrane metalloprotease [Candidatus Wallbacteria bacterium]|nr:CPBP family intramembrane metalloprotease [Candidatus Wallbacteria bacterium]